MNRPRKLSAAAMLLAMVAAMATVMLTITLPIGDAVGQQKTQASDVDRIEAAGWDFIAAISARDIQAMDKLWAHEPYVTFMGPSARQLWSGGMALGKPGRFASASLTG